MDEQENQSRHDLLQYFERVEGLLDSPEAFATATEGEEDINQNSDENERQLFLQNVLKEIEGSEFRLACDKTCSRVLEKMITVSNPRLLHNLLVALQPELTRLLENRYGSHVLQAVATAVHRHMAKKLSAQKKNDHNESAEETEAWAHMLKGFLILCDHMIDNVGAIVTETYASHVCRQCILTLAGLGPQDKYRARSSKEYRKTSYKQLPQNQRDIPQNLPVSEIPDSFIARLKNFVKAFSDDDRIVEWMYHTTASACLQALLKATSNTFPEVFATCVTSILKSFDENNSLQSALMNNVASHLIDECIDSGDGLTCKEVFETGMKGAVLDLALHNVSNYVVQKLLHQSDSDVVNAIFEELKDGIEDIFAEEKVSVAIALIQACVRTKQNHQALMNAFAETFHFSWIEDKAIAAKCILSLSTKERWEELVAAGKLMENTKYTSMGSKLFQALLRCDRNSSHPLAESLAAFPSSDILEMACHRNGSHGLQSFFDSKQVHPKLKQELTSKLLLNISTIASDASGSHIVDSCWNSADLKAKEEIASALINSEETLRQSRYGNLVLRNCKVEHYKHRKDEWTKAQRSNSKRRDMFSDIIDTDATSKSKKKASKQKIDVDEIDELFKSKGGQLKKEDSADEEQKNEERSEEQDTTTKRKKNKKKTFKDISFIAEALTSAKTASKKAKRKGKSDDGTKPKKGKKAN